jgi:predicted membrane-bound mannosyltransferase
VTGADRAVLAGAIVVAAGLVVAFRAFRPVRVTAPAEALTETPAPVLETTGA